MSISLDHTIDFAADVDADAQETLTDSAGVTAAIPQPQTPDKKRSFVAHEVDPLIDQIEQGRKTTGTKILRITKIEQIPELQKRLSPTDLRKGHWQVVTNNPQVKHILRTTSLFFSEGPSHQDQMDTPPMKAVAGDTDELENRMMKMRSDEQLIVRLPPPQSGPLDHQRLRELQESTGGRIVFVANENHAAEEYDNLPFHVHQYVTYPKKKRVDLNETKEMPALVADPPQVLQELYPPTQRHARVEEKKETGFGARLKSGLSSIGKGLRSLWGSKKNTSFEQAL